MRERPEAGSKCSDEEFLRREGLRPLPPNDADIDLILADLPWRFADDPNVLREFGNRAADIQRGPISLAKQLHPEVAFIALQDLVTPMREIGFDIRPVLQGDLLEILHHLKSRLEERAYEPSPPLSGISGNVGGKTGMFFSIAWLRSAGIEVSEPVAQRAR